MSDATGGGNFHTIGDPYSPTREPKSSLLEPKVAFITPASTLHSEVEGSERPQVPADQGDNNGGGGEESLFNFRFNRNVIEPATSKKGDDEDDQPIFGNTSEGSSSC